MKCSELMNKKVYTCPEDLSVQVCAKIMREHNVGFIPVTDSKNHVVGIMTDRDIALRVVADKKLPSIAVKEVMTKDVIRCLPEDHIQDAEDKMAEYKKSRIVIVDEKDRCLGVISLTDIGRMEFHGRAGRAYQSVTSRSMKHEGEKSTILFSA